MLEASYAGLQDQFDLPAVQRILLKQSTEPVPMNDRNDVEFYMANGYVSQDSASDAATHTVTNAYDDFVLAGISTLVGDTSSATAAMQRSKNYANIWSPEEQIFCGRYRTGEMHCPKTPTSVDSWQLYREGDALHWLYFVPHDTAGLMALYPSVESFDAALTNFMDKHVQHQQKLGSALPNPYYWAGNEHNHIAPYLFNFGSNCTKAHYWARQLTKMHFSNTPHGVPGNEDYGAMSTWLLFTSLGLYPIAGTTTFLIGSPRVEFASVRLEGWQRADSTLRIVTHNNSAENVYVQRVLVNGVALTKPFVERSMLVGSSGGQTTIDFFMHSEPTSDLCSK
jgi:predicted alpha-1,2-mannosidase